MGTSPQKSERENIVVELFARVLAVLWLVGHDLTLQPLNRWAYKRSSEVALGLATAFAAAVGAGCVCVTSGFNIWACIVCTALAFLATVFIAFPLVYACAIRPLMHYIVKPILKEWVWPLMKWVYRQIVRVGQFLDRNFGPACRGLVRLTQFVCPGSKRLWATFDDEKRNSWSRNVFEGIFYVLVWCSGAIIGYLTYSWLMPQTHVVLAVVGGASLGLLAERVIEAALKRGKRQFEVLTVAGATVYQFSDQLDSVAQYLSGLLTLHVPAAAEYINNQLGTEATLVWTLLVKIAAFVLFVAYVVPLLDLLLNDLLRKAWKGLDKLTEAAYSKEKNKDCAQLLGGLATAAMVVAAVHYTILLCALPGLSLGWTVAIAAVVSFCAYVLFFEVLAHEYVAVVTGILSGLIVGWEVASHWVALDLWYSYWGAIAAAIVAFLVNGAIVYPVVHLGVRKLVLLVGLDPVGPKLVAVHKWIVKEVLERSVEKLRENYKAAFAKDTSKYPQAFGHVMNLVAVFLAYQGAHQAASFMDLSSTWTWVLVVPSVVLTYLIFGEVLLATDSVKVIGGLSSAAAAICVLYHLFDLDANVWMFAVTAIATYLACQGTWYVAYTAVYRLTRIPGRYILLGKVGDFLHRVHKACWDGFIHLLDRAWHLFAAASTWVYKHILAPAGRWVAWATSGLRRFARAIGARVKALVAPIAAAIAAWVTPIIAATSKRVAALYRRTVEAYQRIRARFTRTAPPTPQPQPETEEPTKPEGEQHPSA